MQHPFLCKLATTPILLSLRFAFRGGSEATLTKGDVQRPLALHEATAGTGALDSLPDVTAAGDGIVVELEIAAVLCSA